MTREERANDYTEHNIGKYTNDYANIYNAYLKGAEEETKELADEIVSLEKENADAEMALSEAKEIIKELLDFNFLPDIEIKRQAEQFLKKEADE